MSEIRLHCPESEGSWEECVIESELKRAICWIGLKQHGIREIEVAALNWLCDYLMRYMHEWGLKAHAVARLAGKNRVNFIDMINGLDNMDPERCNVLFDLMMLSGEGKEPELCEQLPAPSGVVGGKAWAFQTELRKAYTALRLGPTLQNVTGLTNKEIGTCFDDHLLTSNPQLVEVLLTGDHRVSDGGILPPTTTTGDDDDDENYYSGNGGTSKRVMSRLSVEFEAILTKMYGKEVSGEEKAQPVEMSNYGSWLDLEMKLLARAYNEIVGGGDTAMMMHDGNNSTQQLSSPQRIFPELSEMRLNMNGLIVCKPARGGTGDQRQMDPNAEDGNQNLLITDFNGDALGSTGQQFENQQQQQQQDNEIRNVALRAFREKTVLKGDDVLTSWSVCGGVDGRVIACPSLVTTDQQELIQFIRQTTEQGEFDHIVLTQQGGSSAGGGTTDSNERDLIFKKANIRKGLKLLLMPSSLKPWMPIFPSWLRESQLQQQQQQQQPPPVQDNSNNALAEFIDLIDQDPTAHVERGVAMRCMAAATNNNIHTKKKEDAARDTTDGGGTQQQMRDRANMQLELSAIAEEYPAIKILSP